MVQTYSRGNVFATLKIFVQKISMQILVQSYYRGNDFDTIKCLDKINCNENSWLKPTPVEIIFVENFRLILTEKEIVLQE